LPLFTQAKNAHTPVLVKLQQRLVPGDDRLRAPGDGAFENPVVGIVFENAKSLPRLDHHTEFRQEYRGVGELFRIARELASEDAEQLIEDWLRNDELIPLFDDPPRDRTGACGLAPIPEASATTRLSDSRTAPGTARSLPARPALNHRQG